MTDAPDNVVPFRQPAAGDTGDFFGVDRQAWAVACGCGMNAAVSYLVMSRGTLRDMRTTAWSVNAIEQRTHMGRHRAKDAIERLQTAGLVRKLKGGSWPKYHITPAHEVVGSAAYPRDTLSEVGEKVIRHVERGAGPLPSRSSKEWGYENPRQLAAALVEARYLRDLGNGRFEVVAIDDAAVKAPDWIWLPNALVDGAAEEVAPAELVRQSQNVGALRLLVDLYHSQSLARDGGIHWQQLRRSYERTRYGEAGQYVVWGFTPSEEKAWSNAPFVAAFLTGDRSSGKDAGWQVFWAALAILRSLGLVQYVGHAIDADTNEAAVIHPYATHDGERLERILARTAHAAGFSLLNQFGRDRVHESATDVWLLPAMKHQEQVQVVGIARLRYRARTAATALWYEGADEWRRWTQRYAAIQAEADRDKGHATSTGHQREFNGTSTGDQRQG